MDKKLPLYPRILAIAPSASGFGLAVVEDINTLVDCDVKRVRRDINNGCMKRIEKVVAFFEPHVIVMEEGTRRSSRVRALMKRIVTLAGEHGIQAAVLSRVQVRRVFFSEGLGTKDALAELLAQKFPDELAMHLPPKRREWMSEDHRMAMFSALAVALAFRPNRQAFGK